MCWLQYGPTPTPSRTRPSKSSPFPHQTTPPITESAETKLSEVGEVGGEEGEGGDDYCEVGIEGDDGSRWRFVGSHRQKGFQKAQPIPSA